MGTRGRLQLPHRGDSTRNRGRPLGIPLRTDELARHLFLEQEVCRAGLLCGPLVARSNPFADAAIARLPNLGLLPACKVEALRPIGLFRRREVAHIFARHCVSRRQAGNDEHHGR
jgi:hypothetical protein